MHYRAELLGLRRDLQAARAGGGPAIADPPAPVRPSHGSVMADRSKKLRFRSKWTGGIILAEPAIEGRSYEVSELRRGDDGHPVYAMSQQAAQPGEWYIRVSTGPKLATLQFLLLSFEPADDTASIAVERVTCKGTA
jgi:hypothetical protein